MEWTGIWIGMASFAAIGAFHPIVIKCEYYFSARVWPVFLIAGLGFCTASLFVEETLLSAVLAVIGFSSLWSIGELKQQEKRVKNGWFPQKSKAQAMSGEHRLRHALSTGMNRNKEE